MQKLVGLGGAFEGKEAFLNDFQIIGRGPSCHIIVDDPAVSRDQARITRSNGVCQITSTDAAAILLVNGHQTQGAVLRNLDTITVGRTTMQFIDLVAPTVAIQNTNQPNVGYATNPVQYQSPAPTQMMAAQSPPQPMEQNYHQGRQGPGGQQSPFINNNTVYVQVKSDNTALWVILALLFAGPLMCVAMIAVAFLPYVMMLIGAILGILGLVEYSNYRSKNWHVPPGVLVKMWGGATLVVAGVVLLIAFRSAMADTSSQQSGSSSSSNSRP